ncbi:rab11 family-interacting protein 4A-like isoform X2 [Tachypleus tridentatus]|uniref:rab11 family-interacting protein 4A-like isoform X2 n=1 Tax=Tachypleus tridentatus TaxID=6853 RepID=UPI003FD4A63F
MTLHFMNTLFKHEERFVLSTSAFPGGDLVMLQNELTPTQNNALSCNTRSILATSDDFSTCSQNYDVRRNSPTMSDGEEQYESYGDGDDLDLAFSESGIFLDANTLCKPSLSSDSFRSTSSVGSTGTCGQTHTYNLLERNTWLRSSQRKTSGLSKRLSSNALASQLFRGGTPNGNTCSSNSRRSSISCDSAEEMYTDMSLEDDVMDLNQKVQMLQQQVTALTENQTTNDSRYSKVKQENTSLLSRIHSLEEHIRELEIKSEERLKEDEIRLKETIVKQEKEKVMELEHYSSRLYELQQEHLRIKEEVIRLKQQVDKLKQEKLNLQDQLEDNSSELSSLQEEHHKLQELTKREQEEFTQEREANAHLLKDLNDELDELRRYRRETESIHRARSPSLLELPAQYLELEQEICNLRKENESLRDTHEELQVQLLNNSVLEGRNLLHQGTKTLAEEIENLSKDEVMKALREQQEVNSKLRNYIDGILLSIVENYPQLLEVK